MSGFGMMFPQPSEEQIQALAMASEYLERAATQAGTCLIIRTPGPDVTLLQEFRAQLEQSASICATVLEVFDGWPESQ